MRVVPIAFDSLGTRSMCTFVETRDLKVLIDPGVALGPLRYGLSPHPIELERERQHEARIRDYAKLADVLTISHYHYDHYISYDSAPYAQKMLLIKHPNERINLSQRKRAADFLELIRNVPKEVEYADERCFGFGSTSLSFSKACWHGPERSRVGYVLMLTIDNGQSKLMHCSDVQGPVVEETTKLILEEDPDLLIMGGPMSYQAGFRLSWSNLRKAEENLVRILEATKVRTMILDHHLLRDLRYKQRLARVYLKAKELGRDVLTAAEFLGKPVDMLEARRKELWSSG